MWFLKFSLWTKLTLNPESVWFYVIQWNHNAWTHWLHLGSLQVIYDRLNEICDLEDFQQKPSSSRFSRKAMLITIPFPISKSNFWDDFKKIKRFFLILDKIIDSEWRPELMEVRSWFMQPVRQKTYEVNDMPHALWRDQAYTKTFRKTSLLWKLWQTYWVFTFLHTHYTSIWVEKGWSVLILARCLIVIEWI